MRRRRRIRRRKKAEQRAWVLTGVMFLFLMGLLIFHDDTKKSGGNDSDAGQSVSAAAGEGSGEENGRTEREEIAEREKTKEAKETKQDKPAYLENLKGIEPGTVLDAGEIDLPQCQKYFTASEISGDILQEIEGKSYVENDNIGLDDLRYLKLLHYNYGHEIQVGELIVNKEIAEDTKEVFQELFAEEYEIESMYLIDRFWTGDSVDSDTNSIEHNNTSAFNYRVVPDTDRLSNHAAGFAIDINPQQNPYVKYNSDGSFAKYYKDMEKYTDRKQKGKHMITHDDICFKVFKKHGFTWGGDWNSSKDYQHFEKKGE